MRNVPSDPKKNLKKLDKIRYLLSTIKECYCSHFDTSTNGFPKGEKSANDPSNDPSAFPSSNSCFLEKFLSRDKSYQN